MKIINYSEITPENIYKNRRSFIKKIGFGASTLAISTFPFVNKAIANDRDELTSYKDITTYNNYYELELQKVILIEIQKILKLNPGILVLRVKLINL